MHIRVLQDGIADIYAIGILTYGAEWVLLSGPRLVLAQAEADRT